MNGPGPPLAPSNCLIYALVIARTPALSAFPPGLSGVLLGNGVFFHARHRSGAVWARAGCHVLERVGQRARHMSTAKNLTTQISYSPVTLRTSVAVCALDHTEK